MIVSVGRTFLTPKASNLHACSSLIAAISIKSLPVTELYVDFLKVNVSLDLNRYFTHNGLHGLLEEREHQSIDIVFPPFYKYVDEATGYTDGSKLTNVNKMYFELL